MKEFSDVQCECKRCGYEWASRVGGGVVAPKQCPSCKSYSWGKVRKWSRGAVVPEGKTLMEVFNERATE